MADFVPCDRLLQKAYLVLNLEKDRRGGLAKTNTKAVNVINDHAAKFDSVDAWRVSNPDILRYTWRRRKPETIVD